MTPLSSEERRALALLAGLLLLASAARWLERPRSILADVPDVDVATLEDASRAARDDRAAPARPRSRTPRETAGSSRSGGRSPSPTPHGERAASGYTSREPIDPDPLPIDLNTATAQELQRISGIGPAIAARLLARRDSIGRFVVYDDVDAVPGVGPALLARIKAATVLR